MSTNRQLGQLLFVVAVACLLSAAWPGAVEAEEGGTKDSAGIVWR